MRSLCFLLALWASACYAESVPMPALGVELPFWPAQAAQASPHETSGGWSVHAQFGTTSFYLKRFDDPALGDRSPTDPAVQSAVTNALASRGFVVSNAVLTTIGGEAAYTVSGAYRLPGTATVIHDSLTTLIIDHQKLEVYVSAQGKPAAPPEFATAQLLLDGMQFIPVARPAVPAPPAAGVNPQKLPRFMPTEAPDLLPMKPPGGIAARRQGIIDITFAIDDQGLAAGIAETHADYPDFLPIVVGMLQSGQFQIPADWVETGAQTRRFTMEFQFALSRNEFDTECSSAKVPPRIADAPVVRICTSPPRRL